MTTEPTSVIVNFHGVGVPPRELGPGEDAVWLSRAAFEAALDVAQRHPRVRITIDDGNMSDATIALPALLGRGLRASFFVPAGLIGLPGFLDVARVREIAAAGMEVGIHGLFHRPWTELPDEDLDTEILGARDRLELIVERPVREAACPFGAYDRRSLRRLRRAGFRRVFTSDRGVARDSDWLQARNTIHRGDRSRDVERIVAERPGALASALRAIRLAVKRWR